MAQPGYKDFGGSPGDIVLDLEGNALVGVQLTVWTLPVGGDRITDILNSSGTPTAGVVTTKGAPNQGRISFQAPEIYDIVYIDAGSGDRWRILSTQLYEALISAGASSLNLNNRLTTIETSLGSITDSLESYDTSLASVTEVAQAAMDKAEEALGNAQPSSRTFFWRWTGSNLTSGVALEPLDLNNGSSMELITGPILRMDNPSVTTAQVTLETISPTNVVEELYDVADRPSMPVGATKVVCPIPPRNLIADGYGLRAKLITAPTTTGGSGDAVTMGNSTTYINAGTATHNLVLPTAGVVGDTVMVVLSHPASSTVTMNPVWAIKGHQKSDETTYRGAISVFMAPWSADLNMTVTLSAANVIAAYVVILKSTGLVNPFGNQVSVGINSDNTTHTLPGFTSSADASLYLAMASIWYPANLDNYSVNFSGGPAGLVELCDVVSARSATTNFGLWVAKAGAVTNGQVIAPVDLTAVPGSGTGAPAAISWASMALTLVPASSSTPPSYLRMQVDMREV